MLFQGNKAFAIGVTLWFCMLPDTTVLAQPMGDETAEEALEQSVDYAISTLPAGQLGLYNGPDYTPTTITAGGHPYFLGDDLRPETIVYDGILYTHINALFDASRQSLIIEDYAGNPICPVAAKIEKFTIGGHTFKRLSTISGLPAGFYDVLVESKASLVVRRSKSVKALQWRNSSAYYFLTDSQGFIISNKKSLFKSMRDRETDVRRYFRDHKLSFGKAKETSLIRTVQFYSSLKQQ